NILGAYLGTQGIQPELLENIELAKEIKQISQDLFVFFEESEAWMSKYPAW
ncbi:MAG: ADP-ribosylglycohydrolase family protein, partial [Clostridia bacterium]|nr:ADP-ribosylglycohydrolase family protein [Clostridia bacterium]